MRHSLRINYDDLADSYEKHRSGSEALVKELADLASLTSGARALDIGCGTGTTSVAFQAITGAEVWAIDKSAEMLSHAQRKSDKVTFVRADAHCLPFRAGTFDFAYAVLVVHHLEDVPAFFDELYRVMRAGTVAIVTCSHDWIRRHPLNRFFPSFAAVDLRRFPAISSVTHWLHDAGFVKLEDRAFSTEPYVADAAYVKRVAEKWISTLQLIPESEFQKGLKRLRETVNGATERSFEVYWEGVIVSALK